MGKCNWCGKEFGSSGFCSNKCQAESDSYHGISPAERAKSDKDSKSCVGCLMGFIVITYLIAATFFPFFTRKLIGAHSHMELTPWDTTAIPQDDSWVCKYCGLVPSQCDTPSCFAKVPNLHKWLKR